jgi:hypothetical protein
LRRRHIESWAGSSPSLSLCWHLGHFCPLAPGRFASGVGSTWPRRGQRPLCRRILCRMRRMPTVHHSIGWQMMWLQDIVVQEVPKEVTCQESKSSLEVGDKDNPFSIKRSRHSLATRKPAVHTSRNTLGFRNPLQFCRDNI